MNAALRKVVKAFKLLMNSFRCLLTANDFAQRGQFFAIILNQPKFQVGL